MLYVKFLTSPHPRAKIRKIDTSQAEKMPGVAYILTYENTPKTYPMPEELNYHGEVVAILAAETEDLAEDAVEMIASSMSASFRVHAPASDVSQRARPSRGEEEI